jgi:hypothetical protein
MGCIESCCICVEITEENNCFQEVKHLKNTTNTIIDDKISIITNTKRDECSICLDCLIKDVYALPCAHIFHEKCIKQWLTKKTTCPICYCDVCKPYDVRDDSVL